MARRLTSPTAAACLAAHSNQRLNFADPANPNYARRATHAPGHRVNTRKIEETYHAICHSRALCLAASLTLSSLALASNEFRWAPGKPSTTKPNRPRRAGANQRIRRRAHQARSSSCSPTRTRCATNATASAKTNRCKGMTILWDLKRTATPGRQQDPTRKKGQVYSSKAKLVDGGANWKCAGFMGYRCWVARRWGTPTVKHHLTRQALRAAALARRFSPDGRCGVRFQCGGHTRPIRGLASPHSSMSAHPADPRQHGARQRASIMCLSVRQG